MELHLNVRRFEKAHIEVSASGLRPAFDGECSFDSTGAHTHNIHTRRSMLLGGLEMSQEGEEPKGCCGAGSVVCVRVCGLTSIPYTACVEMQL